MADTTPPLDASARVALDKLADITLPAPVPWIPQTWGWAVLGVVLAALIAWAIVARRRRHTANRYRVEALAELAGLEAQLDDEAGCAAALAAVPALLKRVALAAWPRPEVAALSGASWVAFLQAHAAGASVPEGLTHLLDDAEYRLRSGSRIANGAGAVTRDETRAVIGAARAWIEGHRVSA